MKSQPKNLTTSLMVLVGLGCIAVTVWKNEKDKEVLLSTAAQQNLSTLGPAQGNPATIQVGQNTQKDIDSKQV